jgi:signal transduction histidine kinase
MAALLTAVFLYSQFSITRSRALLVLASGYVFSALVVVVRIATFPGAFSPTGLLGAGPQTAAWLYVIWHFGFPVAIFSYVVLKDGRHFKDMIRSSAPNAIGLSLMIVVGLVLAITWTVTAGSSYLPQLVPDGIQLSPLVRYPTGFNLSIVVLTMLLLVFRQTSILDQWLIVSLCALTAELVLVCFFIPERYSLGFYARDAYWLMSSVALLAALHAEVAREYSRALQALLGAKRDRESRLLSIQGATGVLAHEIKQPISAIALEVETARRYLLKRPPNLEEARESLDTIAHSALRVSEVITTIRDVIKRDDQEMKAVDLNEIVADALSQMRGELEAHEITVELSSKANLPRIKGDRRQLLQALLNVLRNAVEALGGVTSRKRVVRIETGPHGVDRIFIKVQDSGPGIDPKIAGEIFDMFKTTKPSGMGLGLALCRIIIEQHGGEIVASSPGGAQIQIFLPAL